MKIEKIARGWIVQPTTSDEQAALGLVLDALEQTYCGRRSVVIGSAVEAIQPQVRLTVPHVEAALDK